MIGVGVKFDFHAARCVNLRIFHLLRTHEVIDARDFADLFIDRNQRETKREHHRHENGEFAQHLFVFGEKHDRSIPA